MKKRLAIIVSLAVAFLTGVAVGATIVGVINLSYVIEPYPHTAVTILPNPVLLDLGTISSASLGTIDFGNCSRLSLADNYRITFELSGYDDFEDFKAWIWIYPAGATTDGDLIYLWSFYGASDWTDLDAGDYDLHIEVEYHAKDLAEATSGQAVITVSY